MTGHPVIFLYNVTPTNGVILIIQQTKVIIVDGYTVVITLPFSYHVPICNEQK